MTEVESFLTPEEEQDIVRAILEAERETTGEIRVHLEPSSKPLSAMERAKDVFHRLKMDNTKQDNGVLIYLAVHDHNFAIYGDKGIDQVVPKDFWNTTRDIMQNHFKKKQFKQGIIEGVLSAGDELKAHFPWNPEDRNELTNEISKG